MSIDDTLEGSPEPIRLPGEQINRQEFPDDFDAVFERNFPADNPREYQKEVVRQAIEGYLKEDKDVVMIDAPPGFGKSIVLITILNILEGDAYYATPLIVLQDQLVNDGLINDTITEIKGRNNYECILPDSGPSVTVDVGKCQRDSDFECPVKAKCPYYAQRSRAVRSPVAVVNMSYLMSVPVTMERNDGLFSPRDVMVVDECQGTDSWAMGHVGCVFSDYATPDIVSENIEWPPEESRNNFDTMLDWVVDEVYPATAEAIEYIDSLPMMDEDQTKVLERLKKFMDKIERFLADVEDNHWVLNYDYEVNKNRDNNRRAEFKPIRVGRFLDDLLWTKTGKILLASATIPKGGWLSEIGLEDKEVKRVQVPSTFPVENRPVILSETVGKMTYDKREGNMPDMVERIKAIAEHHEGEKGIVHCRGYNYIEMFVREARNAGYGSWVRDNIVIQDRSDREGSLEDWQNGGEQLFLSVNMAEGIDLKGDKCRFQVLLKCLYPNMSDNRVDYRVSELGHWDWYNMTAVTQIEQAYGRAVRSEDDHAVFYILDSSVETLIKYNKDLFHDWFLEAVDVEV